MQNILGFFVSFFLSILFILENAFWLKLRGFFDAINTAAGADTAKPTGGDSAQ